MQALVQHHPFHSKQPFNIHFLLWADPRSDADIGTQLTF